MQRVCVSFFLVLACLSCGGSGSNESRNSPALGSATVDSTLPTTEPHFSATARAAKGLEDAGSGNQVSVEIVDVVNVPDVCALLTSAPAPANAFFLLLILGSPTQTVMPGQYQVGTALTAAYLTDDMSCGMTSPVAATTGMVEVTRADTSFAGSFVLTFPSAHIAGNFDAPLCSRPANETMVGDGGAACVQYAPCSTQGEDSGTCMP